MGGWGSIEIVKENHGKFRLACGYFSRNLTDACKAVPGMRWDGDNRSWGGYADAIECVCGILTEKGITVEGKLPKPDQWRDGILTLPVATKGIGDFVLRPYQNEAVKFLVSRMHEGCLLADGMRLGKSASSIVAARAFKEKTLVICPPHVVGVWAGPPDAPKPGEVAKWWPDAWKGQDGKAPREEDGGGVIVLEGVGPADLQKAYWLALDTKEDKRTHEQKKTVKDAEALFAKELKRLSNAMVVVVSSAVVYAWVEVLLRWEAKTCIIDEIHEYSTYNTRRSEAVKEIAHACPRRAGLSGTPLQNRPADLHNVVDILCPNRFGFFFRPDRPEGTYAKTFCGSFQKTVGTGPEMKTVWDHSGTSNEELLNRRLRYMMLRRVKSEVDDQLPPKERQVVPIKVKSAAAVMPSFEILKNRSHLRRLLDLAADAKLKQAVELVRTHVEEGEKVLLFCHRKVFAETAIAMLAKDPCGTGVIHGEVTPKERTKRILEAEKFGGPYVLAATIESCATGIDLSFCTVTVFAELTWEPAELAQAEERGYKMGSGKKQFIQYLIAKGTGDELILRAVIDKLDIAEKVIGKTGDNMREDLLGKRESPEASLDRLADALLAMNQPKKKKTKKSA